MINQVHTDQQGVWTVKYLPGQDFDLQTFWSLLDPEQIPPGLSTTLFDLSLDCKPESHVLEQADQLPQIPQTQGQGWILQLFWSFADPSQIPLGLSTLLFVLVRDFIPASQVVEHVDHLDQEFHSQSTGNMSFYYMGVKCSLDNVHIFDIPHILNIL